jgi:hypothetical protein
VGEVGEEAEIVERQEVDEAMQKEAEEKEKQEAEAMEKEGEFVDLKRGAGTPVEENDDARKRREL